MSVLIEHIKECLHIWQSYVSSIVRTLSELLLHVYSHVSMCGASGTWACLWGGS